MKECNVQLEKCFITELLNDLHRHGFVRGGKAEAMLRDWSRELREASRQHYPASRLRKKHGELCGRENW